MTKNAARFWPLVQRTAPAVLLLACAACGGVRMAAIPTDPAAYRPVELRDVAPTGIKDVNVAIDVVVAGSGVSAFEGCDLVSIETMSVQVPTTGDPAAIANFAAALPSFNVVTLTLPRARYAEVRDLKPFDRIRVRGYLSTYWAQGCGYFTTDAHRYLWVDSVERVGANK